MLPVVLTINNDRSVSGSAIVSASGSVSVDGETITSDNSGSSSNVIVFNDNRKKKKDGPKNSSANSGNSNGVSSKQKNKVTRANDFQLQQRQGTCRGERVDS